MKSNTAYEENQLLDYFYRLADEVEDRVWNFDFKKWLKRILEDCMQLEFDDFIGTDPYERDEEERKNYRNGFYYRSLHTVYGLINDLKVPRPRNGGFTPQVFKKYERREESLNRLMTECYWRGISTRDMSSISSALSGVHISTKVVTRLTKEWDIEANLWHKRPLGDDYVYLMFDGVWIKNRNVEKKKRLILVAYGIKDDGTKEIIDYLLSYSESECQWIKFLTNLTSRGLEGKNLKLVITDGCKGLANAIDIAFPQVDHQLCWAHKMRNILNNVKAEDHVEVKEGLSKIFTEEVTTKESAMKIIWTWQRKWRPFYPAAVNCLDRDLEQLLYYFNCPAKHHSAIRTSNHIERQFKEFRRRMRSMEVLPNKSSANRIFYALTQIRNEKLRDYPLE